MVTVKAPPNENPPLCTCGCAAPVTWQPGRGWSRYIRGHHLRGKPGTRLGAVTSEETKRKMSEAQRRRVKGKRRRDREPFGPGVYATHEYRETRRRLIEGRPCGKCGSSENIHAHHEILGDDESLVPLCRSCHGKEHHGHPAAKGKLPPFDEKPPLCKCGCGTPVYWKRVRGWGTFIRGHGGAKVPAGTRKKEPPLCGCGCSESVKFRYGKGWNKYKRGHGQRVEGHYSTKR